MPISNLFHAGTVMHFVEAVPAERVLDVGIGTGTYGWLLRQYLEVGHERWRKEDWKARIEGIEVYAPYRNPMWDYVYDAVHVGDVRQLIEGLGSFDLIVACDVLEHFPQHEARALAEQLLQHGRVLIATTPNRDFPQGAWGGNEAERHHSILGAADFPHLVASKVTGVTTCYVCTADPALRRVLAAAAKSCPDVNSPKPGLARRARSLAGRVLRRLGLRRPPLSAAAA